MPASRAWGLITRLRTLGLTCAALASWSGGKSGLHPGLGSLLPRPSLPGWLRLKRQHQLCPWDSLVLLVGVNGGPQDLHPTASVHLTETNVISTDSRVLALSEQPPSSICLRAGIRPNGPQRKG